MRMIGDNDNDKLGVNSRQECSAANYDCKLKMNLVRSDKSKLTSLLYQMVDNFILRLNSSSLEQRLMWR